MTNQELHTVAEFLELTATKGDIDTKLAGLNAEMGDNSVQQFLQSLAKQDTKSQAEVQQHEEVTQAKTISRKDVKDGKIRWDPELETYVAVENSEQTPEVVIEEGGSDIIQYASDMSWEQKEFNDVHPLPGVNWGKPEDWGWDTNNQGYQDMIKNEVDLCYSNEPEELDNNETENESEEEQEPEEQNQDQNESEDENENDDEEEDTL